MDLQTGLLSICCLGYNHANFLKENLNSITKIDYPNIEIIVIDDGSQDDSVQLLNQIAKNYPLPIQIITQKNTGNIGKNFNNALSLSRGEFISFISLDDVFNAKIMTQEINLMLNNPKLAFVASTTAQSINDFGYIGERPPLVADKKTNLSIQELLEYEYSDFGAFFIQGSIFRTELIKAVNGFDEDMVGDDIVLRTKLFRHIIKCNQHNEVWQHQLLDQNSIFYRLHDNNIHKNSLRQLKIVTEYMQKYWSDREDPDSLVQWANHFIRTNPDKINDLFTLNERAKKLQNNPKIQECIRKTLDIDLNFIEKIFRKKKGKDGFRTIILFNTFQINYQKKNKGVKTQKISTTHYSEL